MPMSFICLFLKPSPPSPFYNTLNSLLDFIIPHIHPNYNKLISILAQFFTMEFSYQDHSKSSSEEIDRSSEQNNDEMGTGRSYECVFCKRGFTTAQALGGHMNIHRKDRANKSKPNFPPSSSTKLVDENNPRNLARGSYYSTLPHDREVDTNYNYFHQLYFPSHASCGARSSSPSHVQYSEVLCVENQRDPQLLFGQDWRQRGLSLYTNNPLCVHENTDKIENNSEEDDLDLELRLGHSSSIA